MLGLSELKQTKVYQEAFAEGEHTVEFLLGTNPDSVQTPDSPLNKLTVQNAIGQSSL